MTSVAITSTTTTAADTQISVRTNFFFFRSLSLIVTPSLLFCLGLSFTTASIWALTGCSLIAWIRTSSFQLQLPDAWAAPGHSHAVEYSAQ